MYTGANSNRNRFVPHSRLVNVRISILDYILYIMLIDNKIYHDDSEKQVPCVRGIQFQHTDSDFMQTESDLGIQLSLLPH